MSAESDLAINLDRMLRAQVGRLSCGLSPAGLLLVYLDWLTHAAFSPGKQFELARKMSRKAMKFGLYAGRAVVQPGTPPAIAPLPQDQRFDSAAWQQWPFNLSTAPVERFDLVADGAGIPPWRA